MTKNNVKPIPGFSIRRATLDDIDLFLTHRIEMFRSIQEYPSEQLKAMSDQFRLEILAWLPQERFVGFIAETEDKTPVGGGGIMIYDFPPSPRNLISTRAEILNVYVIPAFRRMGIARHLMTTMIAWCRDAGYASVGLHSTDMGRPLYESMGFEPTTGMVRWTKD